ncbi:hypothetical protein MKX01_032338 [Papaver californicum]|nr:hypothetical protein MKX01_032338 [Papaver californicum]
MALQLRSRFQPIQNPNLIKLFSISSVLSNTHSNVTEFFNPYSHEELSRKPRQLRSDEATKKELALHELNERLKKLRVMEEQVVDQVGELPLKSLKKSLLNQFTGPAKELFVEKPSWAFHGMKDLGIKMKLELKKVRDKYKISESDCGSSRVQVAQLTTKIKHLSSVLHKKDKHSRKGLVTMVERRKKVLPYPRRTDWDSYCQVLSGTTQITDTKPISFSLVIV